jgi:hypothetical protein
MTDGVAQRAQANAIILVPGFETSVTREASLTLLLAGIRQYNSGVGYAEATATIEGLSGTQVTVRDAKTEVVTSTDIFEVEWKAKFDFASAGKWWQKLPTGFLLLFSFLNLRLVKSFRESPFWAVAIVLSLSLIVLWLYGTVAIALTAIGHSGAFGTDWDKRVSDLGASMLEVKPLIWATAVLTVLNVDVDRSIDLADLLRRYLFGATDRTGVTMRAQLRQTLAQVVPRVTNAGYRHVSLVAHSFGCVMALDYLDHEDSLRHPIRLVTLGGFLKFLSAENPALVDPLIDSCLANADVTRWQDFNSSNDWIATTTPIRRPSVKYSARSAVPTVSLPDRITGRSHSYYFGDETVIGAIMTPPENS